MADRTRARFFCPHCGKCIEVEVDDRAQWARVTTCNLGNSNYGDHQWVVVSYLDGPVLARLDFLTPTGLINESHN